MTQTAKLVLSALLITLFMACNNTPKPEVDTNTPANSMQEEATIHIPLEQYASQIDLICEMPLKSGVADTTTYQGKLYGFCSSGCKGEFLQNPKAYVK